METAISTRRYGVNRLHSWHRRRSNRVSFWDSLHSWALAALISGGAFGFGYLMYLLLLKELSR